jgi:hypothetical protein
MRRLVALVFLAALLGTAAAQERITSFHSDVTIGADGALTVTETIEVEARGQSIRRGILRDFPTDYRDRAGNRVKVPFEVEQVTRNGVNEVSSIETLSNGVRVRIGSADVLLPHGRHRYEIRYRTARQLGFFDGHDELYWNVTGNGWTFAIDRASASVRLPQPVPAAKLAAEAYTGPQGAQGRDFQARVIERRRRLRDHARTGPARGPHHRADLSQGDHHPTHRDRAARLVRRRQPGGRRRWAGRAAARCRPVRALAARRARSQGRAALSALRAAAGPEPGRGALHQPDGLRLALLCRRRAGPRCARLPEGRPARRQLHGPA